jgi:phosphate starvation-inducible PhoH-like protein
MSEAIQFNDGRSEFFENPESVQSHFNAKQRKKIRRSAKKTEPQSQSQTPNSSLILKKIDPITLNQSKAFDAYMAGKNIINLGVAGSGKSFLAMWLALNDIMNGNKKKKLVIIRSAVQSRAMGFMPGNSKEKMKMYETPYTAICSKFFGRSDAYEILKKRGLLEFESTSFLRGETFDNCVILFDEMQNASFEELQTVLTRVGDNTKIMLCGDFGQNDLIFSKYDQSGLGKFMNIIKRMKEFEIINFKIPDIVRSGLVKAFYVALAKEEEDVHSRTIESTTRNNN